MALYPNVSGDYTFGGRTHTNLVVSEGAAPAEKWIVSKSEGVKFNYAFGPEGNQNVVLAKGKIVEAAVPEFDAATEHNVTAIKIAAPNSVKAIGVNHHNVYETKRDRFSGNAPTVITRNYIEVPLFEHDVLATAQGFASAMYYGAAYGAKDDTQLAPGDFVKVGVDGNFTRLDTTTDNAFEIVGQVLAVERELPPAGFLQYYMEMTIDDLQKMLKDQSYAPSPGTDPRDAGAYPMGYPYGPKSWKADFEKLLNPEINKGIPFLTDGFFKARKVVKAIPLTDAYDAETNNDGQIERVDFAGSVTFGNYVDPTFTATVDNVVGNSVQVAADSRNAALFIKLRSDIDRTQVDNLVVHYGTSSQIPANDVHVDFTNNVVVIYLEAGVEYNNIAIDAPLIVDPVAGVPTEWDYSGAVGAARILLQK